jgi:hypothetical protein
MTGKHKKQMGDEYAGCKIQCGGGCVIYDRRLEAWKIIRGDQRDEAIQKMIE